MISFYKNIKKSRSGTKIGNMNSSMKTRNTPDRDNKDNGQENTGRIHMIPKKEATREGSVENSFNSILFIVPNNNNSHLDTFNIAS